MFITFVNFLASSKAYESSYSLSLLSCKILLLIFINKFIYSRSNGIRTHTEQGLSLMPLPIGLPTYKVGLVGFEPTLYRF